ncbi:PAS domain-containing hybrid sensor histidine kinase/response regulator [Glaciecola sp. 2405UD65-10]|uniref:PAS domain-containing hybrid sensor histidine kinase/response regulator n=1 Tax=Glaciecola sp. 2405UD65-10 TaxID=3397244 RepID=UPI003B5C0400
MFLFLVASLGNRLKKLPTGVYSLALGIHCTSWAFFGTSTQASQFGWALVPTYLGIILFMVFGFALIKRINYVCKQYKIASIAEFVSLHYQHSNALAVIVSLVCFVGVIPYIALQLDAISSAINLLVNDTQQASLSISLFVALGMAIFAIWFGARRMNLLEQNKGLMLTIATQSIIKLIALSIIGIYAVYDVFDGFVDLFEQSLASPKAREMIDKPFAYWIYLSHVVLGVCSMLCLPRQFHVNFVENRTDDELQTARWLFPSYLAGMSLFILPIALAGSIIFPTSTFTSDTFVLAIPISGQQYIISIIGFIGGLAASSSMVIMATLALGNMMANSVLSPLLFTLGQKGDQARKLSATQVLRIRQITILVMLFIAYWYHVYISANATLVETGTIAISLLAQTFPAIILGIYWSKSHKFGAILGLTFGICIILFGMLTPAIVSINNEDMRLSPYEIADVLFISLTVNSLVIVALSLLINNPRRQDLYQRKQNYDFYIDYHQLVNLTDKLLPPEISIEFKQQTDFIDEYQNYKAPQSVIHRAQNLLSAHLGSASTRILLSAISDKTLHNDENMSDLLVQAGKDFQFNREILQASITHLPLGISVIDADLKLVAWNHLYEELFAYPEGYLKVGTPILEILKYNAQRGLLGEKNEQHHHIQKRMHKMLIGLTYKVVRPSVFGKMIEISGHPLPAGGYITCYSDITEYIEIQKALQQSKEVLEERVLMRTGELESAKVQAEKANISKTKFLAATSHDLMQPLNAATLFASMLKDLLSKPSNEQTQIIKSQSLTENLICALDNAEALLSMLVEITKLENNQVKPNLQAFNLGELLHSLSCEYQYMVNHDKLSFHYVPCSIWVNTDRRLLTRIIQNLLSNALRYTKTGRILLGVRRRANMQCEVIIADTGPGIELAYQKQIFKEFTRVHPNDEHPGLGLGLTIVERTSALLNLPLHLQSIINKGSVFSICLPRVASAQVQAKPKILAEQGASMPCQNRNVLVLENDEAVSEALVSLLTSWGAKVTTAQDKASATQNTMNEQRFDLIIADYHLNNSDTGVAVALEIRKQHSQDIPVILSSADRSEHIQALASENNMRYLPKPIKQAALKRLIQRVMF